MPMTNEEQHRLNEIAHARIESTLNRIDWTIHGTNGNPGMKVMVDRNTQSLSVFKRVIWGIMGVLGTIDGGLILASLL